MSAHIHIQELLSHEDKCALLNDPEAMSAVGQFLKQLQEKVSAFGASCTLHMIIVH